MRVRLELVQTLDYNVLILLMRICLAVNECVILVEQDGNVSNELYRYLRTIKITKITNTIFDLII